MKNLKKVNISLSLLTIALMLSCNLAAKQELPLDPEVRYGVLPNGITYYIRHNQEPKERASFYIMQNVGALLETDEQNGLAHFLEHMAFNGTENFPDKAIISTLQKNGVEFGRNLNAYTSFNETVYNISEVPTTTENLMDSCLLILHDWCNYLLLSDEEIDAERGVITEEWRTGNTARRRMWNKRVALMMKDSKYTKRDIIGSMDVVNNFEYDTLRSFYHDWYRTDLQAIAMVGDFDVDEMETKVKELFSPIPAVEGPMERYFAEIPRHKESIFGLVTDKEATRTSINVTFKHEQTPKSEKGLDYYRLYIIRELYEQMFNQRIDELMQKENPPFLNAYSAYFEYVTNLDVYYIDAGAKKNEEASALRGIMIENERAKRHGFTPGELERAKLNYLTTIESAYKQRDKISNDAYAKEYSSHYLERMPAPGITKELELTKELLPNILLEEINKLTDQWISYENMVVIISGLEGDSIVHLTEAEALSIINEVRNSELEAYKDEVSSATLLKKMPKGSKVTNTTKLTTLGAEEWTLKNGIRVIYRFSEIEKDRLYISAISKGGTSLYDVEDLPSAQFADLANEFGIGDYDPTTLTKMLAGKRVSMRPSINTLSEEISGNASPKDAETLFQLLYLTFISPRFDETIFSSKMEQYRTYIENKKNDPRSIISDKSKLILADNHPRAMLFNEEFLNQVDLKKMEKIYHERYADGDDFTFFITGNLAKEELTPLVEQYIGGLKVIKGNEDWVDHNIKMPEGTLKKDIKITMETPKSTVKIKYGDAAISYTAENILYAELLGDILSLRYTEKVREEEGGTYGVGVRCSLGQYPKAKATLSIGFDCDPEKAKELIPIIYRELELIAKEGPTENDLTKVVVTSQKNRVQAFEKNSFWMSAMKAHYWKGIDIVSPSYYEDIIEELSADDIQKFATLLLEQSSLVELVFLPEE